MGPRNYPVTPEEMANFRAILAKDGVVVPNGNSGQIETHGVEISFSYDGTAALTLTILSKPFFILASTIWSQLEGYLPS